MEELKEEVDSGEIPGGVTALPSAPPAMGKKWVFAAAGVLLVIMIGAYLLMRPARKTALTVGTFTKLTSQAGVERFPSLSPDGQSFIYASRGSGNWDIYLKRVGGERVINLTEDSPADDTMPAYSHDGQRIAFRSERDGGGIFIMGATGESVRRLTDFGYDPAWSPDGSRIAFATEGVYFAGDRRTMSQLWVVDLEAGKKQLITAGDAAKPDWSPNGQRIAYQARTGVWTISVDGGEPVKVTKETMRDHDPVWSPDGRSLYFSSARGGTSNVWRVPINEDTGEILGDPEPVTSGAGADRLDTSLALDANRLAYVELSRHQNLRKFTFDPSAEPLVGESVTLTHGSRLLTFVDCSPDDEWLVFFDLGPPEDIGIVRTDGTGEKKLTDDPHSDRHPAGHPTARGSPSAQTEAVSTRYGLSTQTPVASSRLPIVKSPEALFTPFGPRTERSLRIEGWAPPPSHESVRPPVASHRHRFRRSTRQGSL